MAVSDAVSAVKEFFDISSEEKYAAKMNLLRASSLFVGSVFFMRNFGDVMGI
eukprot:CAMPEP_0182853036 /NCGR_PEP_ID=MMETSP0034_2-20130328/485_1 /TAXON_ID=156128 /ORGANISM="Nephroselmis pyriformis, Strain CCMP717" /LENGTH=51 /DNA_ID=CAMNT_0024983783 /DNA_START=55 /DNA_END=210 /DNA_ORIENTATION=-